jgi:hypothetical protein
MKMKWRKICFAVMVGIITLGVVLTCFLCLLGDLPDGLMEAWYILASIGLICFTLAHALDAWGEWRKLKKEKEKLHELHEKRIRELVKLMEETERMVTSDDRNDESSS